MVLDDDDDDDDDDVDDDDAGDDDEILLVVRLTNEKRLSLFPAETIFRYRHHRKSLTRCKLDLNLRRT